MSREAKLYGQLKCIPKICWMIEWAGKAARASMQTYIFILFWFHLIYKYLLGVGVKYYGGIAEIVGA